MNIAIVFYGQPRFFDTMVSFRSHKRWFFDKYDTFVCGHTWWSSEEKSYETSTWSHIAGCSVPKDAPSLIKQAYKTEHIMIEPSRVFTGRELRETKYKVLNENLSNILSHLYSLQSALRYYNSFQRSDDFVILSRYDNEIYDIPLIEELDSDCFYLSNHHPDFPDLLNIFGGRFAKCYDTVYDLFYDNLISARKPTIEHIKFSDYRRRYSEDCLAPVPMDIRVLRG